MKAPSDIDLLLVDEGTYSYDGKKYDRPSPVTIDELLWNFDEKKQRILTCAMNCRWLDIVLVDGRFFGKNADYMRSVSMVHTDPFFFLKLSSKIKRFESENCQWENDNIPGHFRRLSVMFEGLKKEGII